MSRWTKKVLFFSFFLSGYHTLHTAELHRRSLIEHPLSEKQYTWTSLEESNPQDYTVISCVKLAKQDLSGNIPVILYNGSIRNPTDRLLLPTKYFIEYILFDKLWPAQIASELLEFSSKVGYKRRDTTDGEDKTTSNLVSHPISKRSYVWHQIEKNDPRLFLFLNCVTWNGTCWGGSVPMCLSNRSIQEILQSELRILVPIKSFIEAMEHWHEKSPLKQSPQTTNIALSKKSLIPFLLEASMRPITVPKKQRTQSSAEQPLIEVDL